MFVLLYLLEALYHLTKVYYHRDFLELARPRNINPCFIEDSSIYMKTEMQSVLNVDLNFVMLIT